MFPNDAACTVDGRALPDHGEAWSAVWDARLDAPHRLALTPECRTVPVRLEKLLVLEHDAPVLHMRYRMTNLGSSPVPCMLKLHPALAIEEGDEIDLPDCNVDAVAIEFRLLIGRKGKTRRAAAGRRADRQHRVDRSQARRANASAYHAPKWGLVGLSQALHVELRPEGIKVTTVIAGGMRTPFLLERFPDRDPGLLQDPDNGADTGARSRYAVCMMQGFLGPIPVPVEQPMEVSHAFAIHSNQNHGPANCTALDVEPARERARDAQGRP